MLNIDPEKETDRIKGFIKEVLKKTDKNKVVIGLSGGIDSMTSFYLLKKTITLENIIVAHLPYFKEDEHLAPILKEISKENLHILSIKKTVLNLCHELKISPARLASESFAGRENQKIRIGNIAARIRMIILYDLAKKYDALVCGTENKSEHYLGYFTRFGDEASDFEPIIHLYKTQVYKLAKYLEVPSSFIKRAPTAGLWQGQTDEKELGFSYEEADLVLYSYFEKKESIEKIKSKGFKNAEEIVRRALKTKFKHEVPYLID